MSKSDYPVAFSSKPDGARVTIKDENGVSIFSGTTPTTTVLPASAGFFQGKDYTATFELAGYKPVETKVKRGLDGWYLVGNIVFGGLIGWLIVDPATGAMWTLEKNVFAEFLPASASGTSGESLRVATIDQVPAELRANLIRIQ